MVNHLLMGIVIFGLMGCTSSSKHASKTQPDALVSSPAVETKTPMGPHAPTKSMSSSTMVEKPLPSSCRGRHQHLASPSYQRMSSVPIQHITRAVPNRDDRQRAISRKALRCFFCPNKAAMWSYKAQPVSRPMYPARRWRPFRRAHPNRTFS